MQKAIVFLLVLCGLVTAGAVFTISQAADQAIATYAEIQGQPVSAAELALLSRQTPAVAPEPAGRWGMVVLVFAVMFAVGALIAFLFYGERFMKQLRALRKKSGQARPITYLPQHQQPDWDAAPTVRQVRQLPTPRENYHDSF